MSPGTDQALTPRTTRSPFTIPDSCSRSKIRYALGTGIPRSVAFTAVKADLGAMLVVALLLFGGSRVAGMGKGAGRAIREFKEEIKAPTGIEAPKTGEAENLSEPVDAEIEAETRKDI